MGETREERRREERKGEEREMWKETESGSIEGKEEEEERGYSSLVFHLITTKGPRAAVRHIFFNVPPHLLPPPPFSITNIN